VEYTLQFTEVHSGFNQWHNYIVSAQREDSARRFRHLCVFKQLMLMSGITTEINVSFVVHWQNEISTKLNARQLHYYIFRHSW